MAAEWNETNLSDVSREVSYGYTESATSEMIGPKFLRITDIQGGVVNWESVPYCPISEDNHDKYKLANGDIVVARTGNSTGENYLFRGGADAVFASYLIRFRLDTTRVDPRFIWYNLRAPRWWEFISSSKTGSAQAGANAKVLGRFPLRLPPLREQQAIACILGALDDKIELNWQLNRTLEEMARAIFKSWFVDFDPVRAKAAGHQLPGLKPEIAALFPDSFEDSELGEIPKGWRVGRFGDCCDVRGGYAYKSKDFINEGYPLVRIKNITTDKTVDLFDVVYIPEEIALQTKKFWLADGDLIMAMTGATIGKFGLVVNRIDMPVALLNQRVAKIAQKNISANQSWFAFISLLVSDVYGQVVNIGGGSAQPNISTSEIENCRFIVPTSVLILAFTNKVDSMMKRWLLNLQLISTLAALRDALLPKLLSGKLGVPDAERIAARCV